MVPVVVYWVDAHGDANGWTHLTELDTDPRTIRTCGWLLDPVKPDYLTVAQSYDGDVVDHVLHIPRSVVQRVKRLK